jgi:MFS superfamily sulfate permease-like transporter
LLDPFKRKSNFNKDLMAVGSGNLISGLLGGLPMISEVARSSANVSNGARTRWANLFHGLFLLVFMLFLVPVLQYIPKAALSAMLIGVGIKLAHPKEFVHALKIGKEQLIVFCVTIVFTLGVDLLVGIGAGILTEIIINVIHGKPLNRTFKPAIELSEPFSGHYYVAIQDAAVFSNFMTIKNILYSIPAGQKISIDFSACKLIDHSAMENLHKFEHDYIAGGGQVDYVGLENHKPNSDHPFSARKKMKI